MVLLAIVLVAANWRQRATTHVATDGVLWRDTTVGLVADYLMPEGPGARAGLNAGDVVVAIEAGGQRTSIHSLPELTKQTSALPPGTEVAVTVAREGAPLTLRLQLDEQFSGSPLPLLLAAIGVFYLALGVWVLWRRLASPRAVLFTLYCLASFLLFGLSYTGRFDTLDWTAYWLDSMAMLLQPALFAHLCLSYWKAGTPQDPQRADRTAGNLRFAIYGSAGLLAAMHVGFALGVLRFATTPLSEARQWMDRMETGYLAGMYMLGTGLLASALKSVRTRLVWKQIAWVLGGAVLALGPFTVIYAIPYFLGEVPSAWMTLSAVSLLALPAAMAYAMLRHRLLDVDAAIGRGAAWLLATGVLLAGYLGVAALAGEFFRRTIPDAGTLGLLGAVVATGLLLRPLQGWFQQKIDRSFLRDRYDYREAVLQLGRQLGQHAAREQMAQSLLEPLTELLDLERAAVFVPDEAGNFDVLLECGQHLDFSDAMDSDVSAAPVDAARDFGFLSLLEDIPGHTGPRARRDWLHFTGWDHDAPDQEETLDQHLWEHESWRNTLLDMRLPYYFPCRAKGRLVAVLGIGRTNGGELLSEQDEALVETLCGYLALAMESGTLLESLTEKARQYADLRQFSENILESINVGVLAATLDDRVEAINTPLELMVPMPFRQSRGRALAEVLPPDLYAEYERSKADMGVHSISRYRVSTADQPERILNIAIAPLLSRNCECIGRLMVFDDVTDRIALESQLAQADKLSSIGLLAAGVAHEVNTPLTVISTQAQMLEKMLTRPPAPTAVTRDATAASEATEKTAKMLQRIISQTFRASEIVNSLLKFSRSSLSTGPETLSPVAAQQTPFAPVELNQIISETILLVEHSLKTAKIETETHLEPGLALISGHVGKLQQVLLNLILNARDAMPRGGRLRLTTWTDADTVHIEVHDNGVGIEPEHLSRIYDPFFTTKGTGKVAGRDPSTGTGLGLAITYGIVQEHSGLIHVESKPGVGTRFELQFPALRKPVHA